MITSPPTFPNFLSSKFEAPKTRVKKIMGIASIFKSLRNISPTGLTKEIEGPSTTAATTPKIKAIAILYMIGNSRYFSKKVFSPL